MIPKEERENVMEFKVHDDTRGKSRFLHNSDTFYNHCNRKGHDESGCF